MKADIGETTDVAAQQPGAVNELDAAYEKWWNSVQPQLVNENATGPKINPFKEQYWKQFGGGPDEALLKEMDPAANSWRAGATKGGKKGKRSKAAEAK